MAGIGFSTIITLAVVFAIVFALVLMRRTITTIISAVVISIALIAIIQVASGQVLVNLAELGGAALGSLARIWDWILGVFWPSLGEVVDDIGSSAL